MSSIICLILITSNKKDINFCPLMYAKIETSLVFSDLMNSHDKYVLSGLSNYSKVIISVFKQ